MPHDADKTNQPEEETARAHYARRRIVRALLAGAVATLVMFAAIKGLRPALFEDRGDLLIEQCTKTGMAVFAFTLLVSLARTREVDS